MKFNTLKIPLWVEILVVIAVGIMYGFMFAIGFMDISVLDLFNFTKGN